MRYVRMYVAPMGDYDADPVEVDPSAAELEELEAITADYVESYERDIMQAQWHNRQIA